MRIDDLAREAGVASTTVRLYQSKGLLPGPRVVGRTGFYDQSHLSRLRLISRLQEDGFSLASITRLLSLWEEGRDLGDL
ncbi:MAG TPA: MerR family transcriptional regulator, partial [Acidimicrobiales bacterium]